MGRWENLSARNALEKDWIPARLRRVERRGAARRGAKYNNGNRRCANTALLSCWAEATQTFWRATDGCRAVNHCTSSMAVCGAASR